MLLGRCRAVSQGIVTDAHGELGIAVAGKGIGLKQIIALAESVVAFGAEIRGASVCLLLYDFL